MKVLEELFTEEIETEKDTIGELERKSSTNIVSKENLRKVQKRTLNQIADTLTCTYGPNSSNTLILKGNNKDSLVVEYSKDGNKVLKHCMFSDPIEMAIQSEIEQVTLFTDNKVGDGTTSATLLSNAVFNRLCELESKYRPYTLIKTFKSVVSKIQNKIIKRKQEFTLDNVYDLCMISTSGNKEVSEQIKNIYKEFGLDVFIDTAISNTEDDKIRVFDGLTLDEGYSDPAYINTKGGKCILRNPQIYAFNDPIDTPEMIGFMEKIINDNIIVPLTNRSGNFVPTVIISPKISRDASPIVEKLVEGLYGFKDDEIGQKPPIVIVTNLLGGNMDKYYDIAKLCGCKMINKYIDPKIQEEDIKKGIAPTPETIHEFAGSCDMFNADGSDSKFINPKDMFVRGEDGLYTTDENGEYIKSTTYSNLLKFVEDAMNNAIDNSEDDGTIGSLRKRLRSLQSNYVEYMVGGITISDRENLRDLVQDAIRNCRSAANDGFGYAANFEGFRAAIELYNESILDKDESDMCYIIIKAYKDIIMALYTSVYDEKEAIKIIKTSIEKGMPLNLDNDKYDGKVITSIQSDIKILDAISKIVTLMFTANQCLVQAPQINIYQ